jgi:glycerol uptake facilitator-like aquaporin
MKPAYVAEFLGTAALLMVVTGSGIMGEALANENLAIALLGNSIATGAGLYALIAVLAPISGAHFNPVVTLLSVVTRSLGLGDAVAYVLLQTCGALLGVLLSHIIFDLPVFQISERSRAGFGMFMSEIVASLLLLSVIFLGSRNLKASVPLLVAMVVTAGYWFTSSTFFANPAVTLARAFTNTFVGIALRDVPLFVAAQLLALLIIAALIGNQSPRS